VGGAAVGGIVLLLVAFAAAGALAWFYFSLPAKPTIDQQSLCPTDGARGTTVVLVDTSDDLPSATGREVKGILDDLIANLPPLHRLEIRVLDIPANRSRALFSKCNPGDGAGLSEWTDNPRLARMRWIESFQKPANEAILGSLASAKASSSPIMAALQDIAIERFSSERSRSMTKKLVVISDMIEHTRDYSQYPRAGDLSYQRFKKSPAYLKYRTDLHGADVIFDYVTRPSVMPDSIGHATFWNAWVKDNSGGVTVIHRLQGT
jgi:hypothetical protein